MNSIFVIGIFLSFFLQFLLLSKKRKTISDKILAMWMFIIGIHLFSYHIYHLGYWEKFPHLIGITHPLPLLHGPMLFLYVAFSLRTDQHFRWKDWLHFAPAVLSYICMLPFFFYSAERKIMVNHGEVNDYQIFMTVSLIAFIISGIVYPVLSYVSIGKYQRVVNQNFSYNEKINLNWLKYCIWGIGLVYLTVALISVLREGMGVEFGFNADMIFYSQIILFVFFIGYFGIRHEGIFSQNPVVEDQIVEEEKPAGGYRKSGLKQESAEEIHQNLLKLMQEKKPYLESKLTLSVLAAELNVSVNNLSQIINQYQKKNFYDFINEYRVEEFKSRMAVPKNRSFSILAIALDSGFNSKSSFNQVFKKHTGITPSQYVAEIYPSE